MRSYPNSPDAWAEMPVTLTDDELLVGGWQVMQAWERPLMEILAREVTARGGDILEVGFGMGIAARRILHHGCDTYTVIEAHPVIAQMAREWADRQEVPCEVLEGTWQEIAPTLPPRFDGVLFDTYPLSREERGRNHFPFIPVAASLLALGGTFVCYSDDTVDFRSEHLALLLRSFRQVTLLRVDELEPVDGCEYWSENHMVVPVARRM